MIFRLTTMNSYVIYRYIFRDSRGRKALIPIADNNNQVSQNCQAQPYQVQKALVEEKLVPCINFKPYIYTELLMTLPDFVAQYFPTCDIDDCRNILTNVLAVDLYQGNRYFLNYFVCIIFVIDNQYIFLFTDLFHFEHVQVHDSGI